MPDLPTGTVTFLFTDIEGSTRLLDELGDAYAEKLAEHHRLMRAAFEPCGGVEVDTAGDAFFVAFERAPDAVTAAAAAQEALSATGLRVRMGIHTGQPLLTETGYVGMDVHRAARVMSAGHGGQVLISAETHSLLDGDSRMKDVGAHRLKDLTEPQRLWQLGDGEFPPLKALYQSNLPIQPTALVGRESELAEILRLLRESRLVTLTGAGGSGKTRLALQAAAELVDEFKDGVWWVSIAALRDPNLVEPTIAQVVGAKEGLVEHLRSKQTLLLLDNFEQLLEAAPLIAGLLAEAPDLRVLATSRERLGLSGEHEYAVPTLIPSEAVALFTARARQLRPSFGPDDATAEICRRLDGLPLALELAAVRIKVLRADQILERLGQCLDLLTTGARDAPERHQTLRATIEWSHELLGEDERDLFKILSVFAGSFSVEAAEAVCDAELNTLTGLIDKSLLRQSEDGRFFLLETIREFALERLEDSGAADEWHRRHLDHFVAFAEGAEIEMRRADQERWLRLLATEKENLRAAIDWASDHEATSALRLCTALAWFWSSGSDMQEGRRRFASALDRTPDAPAALRASALDGAAVVCHGCGDFSGEREFAREQLQLAEQLGSPKVRARALSNLALAVAADEEDLDRAASLLLESVEVARTTDDDWVLMVSTLNLGSVALARRDYEVASASLDEALALSEASGDRLVRMHTLFNLGRSELEVGDPTRAARLFDECIRLCRELGFWDGVVHCLVGLAGVGLRQGAVNQAARLLGAAEAGREALDIQYEPPEQDLRDRTEAAVRQQLPGGAGERAWTEGAGMSLEEAADYALSIVAPD
jgi:predicted ATPase